MLSLNAAPTGAQLATAQARVIDPVLTTASRGYRNASHIHEILFPRVTVGERGGTRIEFDRTDFRKVNSRRAPGADTKRVEFGHEGKQFALEQHALEGKLPIENAQEAMRVPGIDLGMRTVDGVQSLVSLAREIRAGELASAADNYRPDHVNAIAEGAKWNQAGSNPQRDVVDAVEKVRSKTGQRPTTVVLGPRVFAAASIHASALQQLRYQQKDMASLEDLARLWGVQRVVCGDAIWVDDQDASHDVWGNVAIVAYTPVGGSMLRFEPSFGHGYTLAGTPMVESPYYDRGPKSWLYPVTEEWSLEIVGQDAGYLLTGVVTE